MIRKMSMLGIALFLSFVFCSVSEAVNLKRDILGTWVNNDDKEGEIQQYEFLKDGTVVVVIKQLLLIGGHRVSSAGRFSFIDDNRLKIDYGVGLHVFEVSFDKEGRLNLEEATGEVRRYWSKAEWEKREAPNNTAYNDIKNLRTALEAYYADYLKYPDSISAAKLFVKSKDVDVIYRQEDSGEHFIAEVSHKKGDRIYTISSREKRDEVKSRKK